MQDGHVRVALEQLGVGADEVYLQIADIPEPPVGLLITARCELIEPHPEHDRVCAIAQGTIARTG
jgi:hypothetical protein